MPTAEPPREIERKFLVRSDAWRAGATGTHLIQGYISDDPDRTVRARLAGGEGRLTIKGRKVGASALEFEYPIPAEHVEAMLRELAVTTPIEKTRWDVTGPDGKRWVVDEFAGANLPLVLAEIELEREDELFESPAWLGREVTEDSRFANARLAREPYGNWPDADRPAP